LLAKPEALVHVGDRESDIYELFAAAKKEGTNFLFRTCVDRLTGSWVRVSEMMAHLLDDHDQSGYT
jgi:hypothetical protein